MTPQARAAADRLAAFLALPEYASDDIRVLGLCRTGQSHYDAPVTTGELRLVLAALDRHKPRTAVEGPLEGKPICDECSDGTNEWLATADPCPTKRAIAEKLGVEVDDGRASV